MTHLLCCWGCELRAARAPPAPARIAVGAQCPGVVGRCRVSRLGRIALAPDVSHLPRFRVAIASAPVASEEDCVVWQPASRRRHDQGKRGSKRSIGTQDHHGHRPPAAPSFLRDKALTLTTG